MAADVGHIHPWVALLCPPGPASSRPTKPCSQGRGTEESGPASVCVPSARFPWPKHSQLRREAEEISLPLYRAHVAKGTAAGRGPRRSQPRTACAVPSTVTMLKNQCPSRRRSRPEAGARAQECLRCPRYAPSVQLGIMRANSPAALELGLHWGLTQQVLLLPFTRGRPDILHTRRSTHKLHLASGKESKS